MVRPAISKTLLTWGLRPQSRRLPSPLRRFPIITNTLFGLRSADEGHHDLFALHRASRFARLRKLRMPGALPAIFTGLRLSLQACWTTLVAGELIGAIAGLGHVLYQGSLDIFPAMIMVGMLGVALTGAAMTGVLASIESRAMPWRRA